MLQQSPNPFDALSDQSHAQAGPRYGNYALSDPKASVSLGAGVRIGAVVSPVTHKDFYAAHESIDALRHLDAELFARTSRAADPHAKVIVWNEIATVVTPSGENDLALRGLALARERGVLLLFRAVRASALIPRDAPYRSVVGRFVGR